VKKKKRSALILSRETIRHLDAPALRQAPGGCVGLFSGINTSDNSCVGCLGVNLRKTLHDREDRQF
jgi:hypothetical protein